MFLVYYVSVTTIGTDATDWVNDTLFGEMLIPAADDLMDSLEVADWLHGLIVDGIISGVGAVLGFVPQMVVLFIFLAFLEACGYMARIAFILDRAFRKFGLSGKSFIPMLIGSGCGVPGIMASRTIENESDRRMTIMTTTMIRQDAYHRPDRWGLLWRRMVGGSLCLLCGDLLHHHFRDHLEKDQAVRRGSGSLRHGTAPLPHAHPGEHCPERMGTELLLHQEGRHSDPAVHYPGVVPVQLRLGRRCLYHAGRRCPE